MGEARLFQALSDSTRLEILSVLAAGTVNVSAIVARVGCSQPAVSRHLRVLREASLIRGARKGKQVEYSISPQAIEAAVEHLGGLIAGIARPGAEASARVRASGAEKRGRGGGGSRGGRGGRAGREASAPAAPARRETRSTGTGFKVERKPEGMDDFLL